MQFSSGPAADMHREVLRDAGAQQKDAALGRDGAAGGDVHPKYYAFAPPMYYLHRCLPF